MVHENVVRRSVNLETGKEEIEVLDAGDLAVERFLKRPARNRTVQSGNVLSRRTHGAESARNTGSAGRSYTRSCAQESRRRRALAVQSGVSRPAPMSLVKSTQKNAVTWLLREGTGRPLAPIRHT